MIFYREERPLFSNVTVKECKYLNDIKMYCISFNENSFKILRSKPANGEYIYLERNSYVPDINEFEDSKLCPYSKVDNLLVFKTTKINEKFSIGSITKASVEICEKYIKKFDYGIGEYERENEFISKFPLFIKLYNKNINCFDKFVPRPFEYIIGSHPSLFDYKGDTYITIKLEGVDCSFFTEDSKTFIAGEKTNQRIIDDIKTDKKYLIQGELVGTGIRKNIYGLKDKGFFVFTIIDLIKNKKLNINEQISFCEKHNLKHVPILPYTLKDFKSTNDLQEFAESIFFDKDNFNPNVYYFENGSNRRRHEGIVVRSSDQSISFKVISFEYEIEFEKW
jgi:hypothetical protein